MANILILKFPYSSTYGGGEKHTIQVVEELMSSTEHRFWLASSCSVLLPEFAKRGWPTRATWGGTEPVTPKALLLFFFTWPFILANLVRLLISYKVHHGVSIIYCLSLTEKVLLAPWARLLGMRVIWMEHTLIERWLQKSPLRFAYVLWSRLVTIITVAQALTNQLVTLGVPASHVQVIYNSVDTENIPYMPTDPTTLQQRYNIMYIGRIAFEKGLADLLQAVQQLQSSIPQAHLTIVGQGPWQAELDALIQQRNMADSITLAGFQSDITPWLEQAHVVVLPSSRRETFGLVIAEALAAGKPVIGTLVGGIHELVGEFGTMVPPSNPDALATALQNLYTNYPAGLEQAKRGRQHVLDEFTQTRMIHEYDTLFEQLA